MKLTNLSLAIMVAAGVAACGGSGDDNSNKPADPPKPTPDQSNNNNNTQTPAPSVNQEQTVDPTGTKVVDNKDLTKENTVGVLQYIRRDGSQYDRALNPGKKASASPLLGTTLNEQNPQLTNIVLARQDITRADGTPVKAQFAGMDNPQPLKENGEVNYDSVIPNNGGLSLQEENFKNVDVLAQLYQVGNASLSKTGYAETQSNKLGLHADNKIAAGNAGSQVANNLGERNQIHRAPVMNTKDDGTNLGQVYHFAYVKKENGVYKRVTDLTGATKGAAKVNGDNNPVAQSEGSVAGSIGEGTTSTDPNPGTVAAPTKETYVQKGVAHKLTYDNGGTPTARYGVVSDAKTVTAVIDPYAIDVDGVDKSSDSTVTAANANPLEGYKKITSKDVEGNKDVYMYRGSSKWKGENDPVKQAVTPEFANSAKGGTRYGKNLVWWTTPETAFENHFTRTGSRTAGADMPVEDGNYATNGLIRVGGGLSTLGQELQYNATDKKWEDHHNTTTRIFGRYHLAYASTHDKDKGVHPVALNSYSGARSFVAEYVSKAGGSYNTTDGALIGKRGTADDEAGEATRYSLGAVPMTLKNIQYGRVTTQLDVDAGDKGYADNFIRSPYRNKDDADAVDNYFYRGINATTIEQMAALPSDQKAVYRGHALMYGIDNSYHGTTSGNLQNLPNAFANQGSQEQGLGLGNFVEARVDFGKKRVLGEVYNEWLLDQNKAETTRDKLVRFQGNITGNTVVGSADRTYVEGDDCAVFKASFYGEKAEEMGGSFNTVQDTAKYGDAYGQNDWGGVFGASRGDSNTFQGDDGNNVYGGN